MFNIDVMYDMDMLGASRPIKHNKELVKETERLVRRNKLEKIDVLLKESVAKSGMGRKGWLIMKCKYSTM